MTSNFLREALLASAIRAPAAAAKPIKPEIAQAEIDGLVPAIK